jgi:hypothetical protein
MSAPTRRILSGFQRLGSLAEEAFWCYWGLWRRLFLGFYFCMRNNIFLNLFKGLHGCLLEFLMVFLPSENLF